MSELRNVADLRDMLTKDLPIQEWGPVLESLDALLDRIRAQAWDEGKKSGLRYAERALAAQKIGRPDLPGPPTTNPYRADQIQGDDDDA